MSRTWITSDLHIGHNLVAEDDMVYILEGETSVWQERAKQIMLDS